MSRAGVVALLLWISLPAFADGGDEDEPPKRWAILIGVNTYEHLKDLKYCGRDMAALKDVLIGQCGYRSDHIHLLTDDERLHVDDGVAYGLPLKTPIESALDDFLGKAREQDTVLFAFAGHGIRDGESYLMLAKNRLSDRAGVLELGRVQKLLARCPAKQGLLIIDACRNGDFTPTAFPTGKNFLQLFSCEGDQKSWEDGTLGGGHGVFSHFVVEGLKDLQADTYGEGNRNGKVTAVELFHFVSDKVRAYSTAKNRRQTPHMQLNAREPIVLAFETTMSLGPTLSNEEIKERILAEESFSPELRVAATPALEVPRTFGPGRELQNLLAKMVEGELSTAEFLKQHGANPVRATRIRSYILASASLSRRSAFLVGNKTASGDSLPLIRSALGIQPSVKIPSYGEVRGAVEQKRVSDVLFVVYDGKERKGGPSFAELMKSIEACPGHVVVLSPVGNPGWPEKVEKKVTRIRVRNRVPARIFITGAELETLADVVYRGLRGAADRDASHEFLHTFRRLGRERASPGEDGFVTLRELARYAESKKLKVYGHFGNGDVALTKGVLVVD